MSVAVSRTGTVPVVFVSLDGSPLEVPESEWSSREGHYYNLAVNPVDKQKFQFYVKVHDVQALESPEPSD